MRGIEKTGLGEISETLRMMQALAWKFKEEGEGHEQDRHVEVVTLGCDSERLITSDNERRM